MKNQSTAKAKASIDEAREEGVYTVCCGHVPSAGG